MRPSRALLFAAGGIAAVSLASPAFAAPPLIDARAYVVEDGTTGEVLAQRAARLRVPIASITKLMTVLITLERTRPSAIATVPPDVTTVGESSIYLRAGERMSVRDLIEGALIPSANDAADTLADFVGKGNDRRFVAMMNAHARRLGLLDTHYVRPEGLDAPNEYSSARDVTKLARILMHRPLVRAIVRKTTATISGARTVFTRNNLLNSFPGAIGVKTGHTSGAGWCEVAAARRNGVTVYATVLGAPSESRRDADLAAVLRWGFSQYRRATLVPAHTAYARVPSGFGRESVPAVAVRPLVRLVRIGRPVVEQVVLPDAVSLPVTRGQGLGTVRLYARGRLLGARRLVAARAVSAPGFADRVGWYLGRAFHNIAGWFG